VDIGASGSFNASKLIAPCHERHLTYKNLQRLSSKDVRWYHINRTQTSTAYCNM